MNNAKSLIDLLLPTQDFVLSAQDREFLEKAVKNQIIRDLENEINRILNNDNKLLIKDRIGFSSNLSAYKGKYAQMYFRQSNIEFAYEFEGENYTKLICGVAICNNSNVMQPILVKYLDPKVVEKIRSALKDDKYNFSVYNESQWMICYENADLINKNSKLKNLRNWNSDVLFDIKKRVSDYANHFVDTAKAVFNQFSNK